MKTLFTLSLAIQLLCCALPLAAQTRVVCVGNSVTAGYGLSDPGTQAWPAQLGTLLGNQYTVLNCGVSGTTMLKKAPSPYWNTSAFTTAKNFDPQILIISLGTNDAHPDNWIYKNDFYNDYASMIDAFRQNGRNPAIYVVYPVACYADNAQIANLQNEVIPLITQISINKGATVIDFNSPTQNKRNTLYNDNLHPNAAGAAILGATAYAIITPAIPTFYSNCSYGGYGIKLGIGDYTYSALSAKGIANDDISSIKIPAGYKAMVYADDNFGGSTATFTGNDDCLGDNGWDNRITSIKIRANGVTGKSGTYSLQNRNSGKYMDVAGGNPADGTNILQWTGTGATNQQFTLTDLGDGTYKIINVATGKAVDVVYASTNNVANVQQWTYSGNYNQQFILLAADNNYYKLKAAHSGRVVEVYGGGLNAGDNIDQYDDNNQTHGQWKLAAPGSTARTGNAIAASPVTTAKQDAGEKTITLFPNPATGIVTLTNVPANTDIHLFDLNGRETLRKKSHTVAGNITINVSNLSAGTYLVKVGNGSKNSFKLIKQ
ncbi:RICIN domain-containing protein [Deminuibacter soli]|uniref:T9SS C-terminal target domain-containing protein n=1 Tax=Deminuibacter soli TaxID=2291815 RepID=A0A3E1NM99_9BACT|nr:RICIN domain-containing protein [Deminuibacter soli]RFM29027.1 T9SS C-terminal target domain-containing protein [Deminuibacter soli]